ncbi:MAG: hypothetical protein GY786_23185 [Proteobacteria bacterium]|nr:hypothetical protein [Pseudomonadota bacterium]
MDILFLIFILPIQMLMASILEYANQFTGNYIVAIVILSIIINIILLPLYHFAEKLQNKERIVQSRLQPKMDEIKFAFEGAERFMMIHTLYRQAKYHPIYAVRTSLGFLIQVPFFLAAYLLLLNYEPVVGLSILGFSDLSQPDNLFYGINIMPIIMTLVNLASGFVYSRNFTKNEKIQIWVVSLLFLVLLYQSPAVLVIYWTLNNLFSLIKNVGYHYFSDTIDIIPQSQAGLWDRNKELWQVSLRKAAGLKLDHILSIFPPVNVVKIFLFVILLDRVLYLNLFLPDNTENKEIYNIGMLLGSLFLFFSSLKTILPNFVSSINYLKQKVVCLFDPPISNLIYSIIWSVFFGVLLAQAKRYFDLAEALNKTHTEVSNAIAASITILIVLCLAAAKTFYAYFDKEQRSHRVQLTFLALLTLLSGVCLASWLSNSYLITEPIYIKEALAGFLCIILVIIHYEKLRRATHSLAVFRNKIVNSHLTNINLIKLLLLPVLFFNFQLLYGNELSIDVRQYYQLQSTLILALFFFIFLNKVDSYGLKPNILLFLSSATLLFYMILVSGPMILYASSLENIHISKFQLVIPHLLSFLGVIAGAVIIYFLVSESFKKLYIFTLLFLILVTYFYTFVMVKDFGQLDAFLFHQPSQLDVAFPFMLAELLSCILIAIIVWNILPRIQNILSPLLMIVLVSVVLFSSFKLISNEAIQEISHDNANEDITKLHTYSKHQNIIIMMLDGFSGIEINRLLTADPDFFAAYTGFKWYPNILTTGTATRGSIAALSSGHQFTANAINRRKGTSFHQEIQRAYMFYPNNFLKEGFEISYIKPQYGNCKAMKGIVCFASFDPLIERETEPIAYKTINMISLFGAAPFSIKKAIYDNGDWLTNTQKNIQQSTDKVKHWEFLKRMEDNIIVSDKDIKTLKYYQFKIPHAPSIVNKKCNYTSYGDYRSEASCALMHISKFITQLKEKGIYDVTKLILVSDHGLWHIKGTGTFNQEMRKNMRRIENESRENRISMPILQPLLLVKDFNRKNKNLKIDNTFMSNADVPSIVCSAIGGCPGIIPDPTKQPIQNRKLYINNAFLDSGTKNGEVFVISNQYEVTNSIFEWKNWKKLK